MKKRTRLGISLLTVTIGGLVLIGSQLGMFALTELRTFDWLKRISPKEERDHRIVIVSIKEMDLRHIGKWPMSDRTLTRLLNNIKAQQPAVIGIDIYRDLPVEPGHQELVNIFATTSNLIGITKIAPPKVAPPPILASEDRVAASDFVLDADGKIRRSLIFIKNQQGLGMRLATFYLKEKGINLMPYDEDCRHKLEDDEHCYKLRLGKATFFPLTGNEGEYNSQETDGYQTLLNYRGEASDFEVISLTDVLENRIPQNLLRDRIVLIGVFAPSLNDIHQTPYMPNLMPGVVLHANVTSQTISAALDGRPLLQATSKTFNWLWLSLWAIAGAICGANFIRSWQLSILFLFLGFGIIIIIAYYALQLGWWLPVTTPIFSLLTVAIATTIWELGRYLRLSYKQLAEYAHNLEQKVSDRTLELQRANLELSRLAVLDGLTQIANRRRFDDYLHREWIQHMREQKPLALILIDIDYFKYYNDHYGHQGGDDCLIRVAKAIDQVPQRPTDLVARYGGEEFVAILPDTDTEGALIVAESIQKAIAALAIPHAKSDVSQYVTLSLGVVSLVPTPEISAESLIAYADQSLYEAKKQGRNRAIATKIA